MADELYIGPATRRFYTVPQLRALKRHSGGPLVVISSDDYKTLSDPEDVLRSMKEIRRWIPSYFQVSERSLVLMWSALKNSNNAWAMPMEGRQKTVLTLDADRVARQAGVIILPSWESGLDNLRSLAGLNFKDGILNEAVLNEWRLIVAAHEASHLRLMGQGKDSEVGADMGSLEFYKKHPEFFPHLTKNNQIHSIVLGARAFKALVAEPILLEKHDLIPLAAPDQWRDQPRMWYIDAALAFHGVMRKTAERMYEKGMIPAGEDHQAFDGAFRGVASLFRTSRDRKELGPFYKRDETGLIKKYLDGLGIKDFTGKEAEQALTNFKQLENLYKNPPETLGRQSAESFMRQHGLSRMEVDAFMEQGKITTVTDILEKKLSETRTVSLCQAGERNCAFLSKVTDPANPFLHEVVKTVRQLNAEGAFESGSREEKTYVGNLLAGAEVYLEPPKDNVQPTPPRSIDAPRPRL